jgi:hypothetical protein
MFVFQQPDRATIVDPGFRFQDALKKISALPTSYPVLMTCKRKAGFEPAF